MVSFIFCSNRRLKLITLPIYTALQGLNVHGLPLCKLPSQPLNSCIHLQPYNHTHTGIQPCKLGLRHTICSD